MYCIALQADAASRREACAAAAAQALVATAASGALQADVERLSLERDEALAHTSRLAEQLQHFEELAVELQVCVCAARASASVCMCVWGGS